MKTVNITVDATSCFPIQMCGHVKTIKVVDKFLPGPETFDLIIWGIIFDCGGLVKDGCLNISDLLESNTEAKRISHKLDSFEGTLNFSKIPNASIYLGLEILYPHSNTLSIECSVIDEETLI
jgi:hypothetical protein